MHLDQFVWLVYLPSTQTSLITYEKLPFNLFRETISNTMFFLQVLLPQHLSFHSISIHSISAEEQHLYFALVLYKAIKRGG